MSSLAVKVKILTLTGVQFEVTLQPSSSRSVAQCSSARHSPSSSSASSTSAPSSLSSLRVSDVKRVLPFPSSCTTLVHRGLSPSDDTTLSSLRVSDPFVVILDKAKWRQSLATAAATSAASASATSRYATQPPRPRTHSNSQHSLAHTSNKRAASHRDDDAAEDDGSGELSFDEMFASSGRTAASKRFRRDRYSDSSDEAMRYSEVMEAMRRRRERYLPLAAPATDRLTAEEKEREGKSSDEPPAGVGAGECECGGECGSDNCGSGRAVVDSASLPRSSSISSRLRSSIQSVEQMREARDRVIQMQTQHRSGRHAHSEYQHSISASAVKQLESMGFQHEMAARALKRCGGNLSDAIELLMMPDDNHLIE